MKFWSAVVMILTLFVQAAMIGYGLWLGVHGHWLAGTIAVLLACCYSNVTHDGDYESGKKGVS